MAFAAGSALFVLYVRANATVRSFAGVLQTVGALIGVGILVGALVLRDPPNDWLADIDADANGGTNAEPEETGSESGNESGRSVRQYEWRGVVRTWQFWVMYAMFVGVSGANLMLAANLVPFAENVGLSAAIATASATLLPIADGIGRLSIGGISDRFGRERSMAVAFSLCGIGLFALIGAGQVGTTIGFLGAVALAAFFEGTQYSLFPSVVGDYYGQEHSSTNYAVLYSAKVVGGIFGGAVVGWLVATTSWETTFLVGGVLAIAAGFGAVVLRPPHEAAQV